MPLEMTVGPSMTGLTVSEAAVVKIDLPPIGGIVAVGALAREMVDGFDIGVTGLAVGETGVVEGGNGPVVSIGMAGCTFARVVVDRFIFHMA